MEVENDGVLAYKTEAALRLGVCDEQLAVVKILSKLLDISNKEQFFYKVSIVVEIADDYKNEFGFEEFVERKPDTKKKNYIGDRPIIVGFGPAGMFAALEFIENGVKPLVFERGKKIEDRQVDVQSFIESRQLNSESNIQFGEGGAGSFSDGKLFSRMYANATYVAKVLKTFVKFGAPKEIEYIARPHLGTDVLCRIVKNIRTYILDRGGDIFFSSKMTDILISEGKAFGIVINGEKEYFSSNIFIAFGHSARKTLSMMRLKGIAMEQKSVSIGMRMEHPVDTINEIRYGNKYKGNKVLGAATYSLNYTNRKLRRNVNTFCMCPGGEVINASSEQGMLVINGMSYSKRSSNYSNAALIVTCHPDDFKSSDPLAGIEFQKEIERKAFVVGGESWKAPAQNLMSFLSKSKGSSVLNSNSFKMGVVSADMKEIFPSFIIDTLLIAFAKWKNEDPLFISDKAILIAAETRTSSPVRIKRNKNFESENIKNLYIIGEGSGYAGGITSSAADAIKAVEKHLSNS